MCMSISQVAGNNTDARIFGLLGVDKLPNPPWHFLVRASRKLSRERIYLSGQCKRTRKKWRLQGIVTKLHSDDVGEFHIIVLCSASVCLDVKDSKPPMEEYDGLSLYICRESGMIQLNGLKNPGKGINLYPDLQSPVEVTFSPWLA